MGMVIKNKRKQRNFSQLIPLFPILLLVVFLALVFRNNNNISKLRNDGNEVKGLIYKKSEVGSKGTIRCFYNFEVECQIYEGFYDNNNLNQWDSIEIIYYIKDPSLNQAKQFVLDY